MSKKFGFILGVGLLVSSFMVLGMFSGCGAKPFSRGAKGAYYSVTLTNNNLFFAKIKGEDDQYLYLTDIHYLQRTPPQPAEGKNEQPGQPGIRLVRQVNDPMGPKDEMVLNREHLLYYQELREDSNVVQGIRKQAELAEQAAKAPVTPAPPQQNPPPAEKAAPPATP